MNTPPESQPLDPLYDPDDESVNPTDRPSLADVIETRLSRRTALSGMLAGIAATTVPSSFIRSSAGAIGASGTSDASTLTFEEIDRQLTATHRVSPGHSCEVLIRSGDPILEGAPPFDHQVLNAKDQEGQFGCNNDFVAYQPLPRGSENSTHGLLCVNHEYTSPELMWPGGPRHRDLNEEQVAYEMAAHGVSVTEIVLEDGRWRTVVGGAYARRITADTPIAISGPAAGHPRMQTRADPTGRLALGTVYNCAGGMTPWGTVLTAEENFNYYFSGDPRRSPEVRNHARYNVPGGSYGWAKYHERFNVDREPHEPNRFGWVVEIDPYDPTSTPVKRTALGRFKHEGSTVIVNHDGRVVVYSGDDQVFEYVYRYVSRDAYDASDPESAREILDHGTLSVARFDPDGVCHWLPLVFGEGPLTADNQFYSQADVLIEARRAADLLGATPMDRPEDIEPNPFTGKVYVMLTKNHERVASAVDAANPKAVNAFGHIIELVPPGRGGEGDTAPDHAADTFKWNIFLRAGNPEQPEHESVYHPDVSRHGWLVNPDNGAFDNKGRLWIATDQGAYQAGNNVADGMWATDTEGEGRALTKMFFACPDGAEMAGPCFTPDGTTIFLAVQHPGEGGPGKPSTYDAPTTRWPDFEDGVPPRSAIVAIRREDGGEIGG